MENTDSAGFPFRTAGDKLIIGGEEVVVLENLGNPVLCPCPDTLKVKFIDRGVIAEISNADYKTW